ncbi:MAG: DUF1475 family protein [Bacillota bacterium]|nr:DUF1475 family protein [Bacillota bacterium]
MKTGKLIAWICLIAMTLGLMNGFINGDFFKDGGKLLTNPWGIMSLIDLYVGFTLFSMWIAFREESKITALVWIVLMMILGFFTASLYILILFYKSKGDWVEFFFGDRKDMLNTNN